MDQARGKKYWYLAFLLSLAAIGLITWLWYQAHNSGISKSGLVRQLADVERVAGADCAQANSEKIYCIPTGVFIQSLHYSDASEANLNGYIWQKYAKTIPNNIERGVIFPEEINSINTKITKAYEYETDEYVLIGWYFDVTLRQAFDYRKYPLDTQSVWLRIWPAEIEHDDQIMLIPDFSAYPHEGGLLPTVFGLDEDIVPGGWVIGETYFNYRTYTYDTNFGFVDEEEGVASKYDRYHELLFNIGVKRKFRNAFIINLVPLLVVALLLFSQVMMVTDNRERAALFGSNTSGVIATCSALFFVVMLAHIQVRSQFAGSSMVYIEYFYLVMYFMILMVALNAYLFSLGKLKQRHDGYLNDNFFPKVTFWPLLLWLVAIATLIEFGGL